MEKQNVSLNFGDSQNLIRNYDQKIQYRTYRRSLAGFGTVSALVRFDDDCKNGHCTLSVTANVWYEGQRHVKGEPDACGCCHEDISRVLPELRDAIKFHLVSTDGPMHYVANTVFLAGNRDCWGKAPGEVSRYEYGVKFGDSPVTHRISPKLKTFIESRLGTGPFTVSSFAYEARKGESLSFSPKYTLTGFGEKWHECPFNDEVSAQQFAQALNETKVEVVSEPVEYSKGKERELDKARSVAIWPEATDEELSSEPETLKARLTERLPSLLAEFRTVVESLGFDYEFPAKR